MSADGLLYDMQEIEQDGQEFEDGNIVDYQDGDDGYYMEEDDTIDMFEEDEGDPDYEDDPEQTADDYGVTVDIEELSSTDDKGEPRGESVHYRVADKESSFISQSGEIVVMDRDDGGDNFQFDYIDIRNIAVVRRVRQNKNVADLVKSIKSTGLLEPIVVAPTATDEIYVLISGFRRLLACAKVGIKNIPCIINTKVNTPEIPILEAMYNHSKRYSIQEIIKFIEYLEKEKGIMSASMIEFLLQMDNGDYTKLKDLLNDDDEDIMSKLLQGQITIAQAFQRLEGRRRKESKEEKDLKKAEKAYDDNENTGAEKIEGSGEVSDDGEGLTDEEISELAVMAGDLDSMDGESLEDMIEEGDNIEGFQPHKQTPGHRERLDPALRKSVLARDNNTCKCCGISGQEFVEVFDVHHIIEVYLGGNDDIDNLITVCLVCHKMIHLFGRGELHIRPIEQMDEQEKVRFKRVVKLGNIIRKGLALKGMKRDELKKLDKAETIGRTKPGTGQVAG